MTGEPASLVALSALRVEPAADLNLLVADERWTIVILSATDIWAAAGIDVSIGASVPSAVQKIIISALGAATPTAAPAGTVRTIAWPGIALTIAMVDGAQGRLVAISAARFRPRRSLVHAQRTFGLSPREVEILRHVLGGAGTSQIAGDLSIADSTVIAHIKSLLVKTRAANRAALVARVLGWEPTLDS